MTEIGEPFNGAGWYVGPVARENVRALVVGAFAQTEAALGVVFGPITWSDLTPDEAPAPAPENDNDQRGVMMLVGEAKVVSFRARMVAHSFLAELEDEALATLRQETRQAHRVMNPMAPPLTDAECDDIIERLGPDVAARQIMGAVN